MWSSMVKWFGKSGSKEEKRPFLEQTEETIAMTAASVDKQLENKTPTNSKEYHKDRGDFQGNYFQDRTTKIDFILVFEKIQPSRKRASLFQIDATKATKVERGKKELEHEKWRNKFTSNLRKIGMLTEEEAMESQEKTVYYLKISCPWERLIHHAEELNLRAPLKVREYKSRPWSKKILKVCKIPNCMKHKVPNEPKMYFTCTFKKSKLHRFLNSDQPDIYFSNTERSRITWKILQETAYGRHAKIGIERLLAEGAFTAAFPLHEGGFKVTDTNQEMDPSTMNRRQVLYQYWARWGVWYKYQPLDHIRDYFGEKISIYFAWLGFYTSWLLPVAILGLLIFIIGAVRMHSNIPASEICSSGKAYIMCPICNSCDTWFLSQNCLKSRFSFLFDNSGTVVFATLMSFWAVLFLEFWKRRNAQLAFQWEVMDYEEEVRPRPEYCARALETHTNPVTQIKEPYFCPKQRRKRIATGLSILLFMLAVVLIFVVSVIIYKSVISLLIRKSGIKLLMHEVSILRSVSGAILNLILIMLMENLYTAVAELLTKWEMHRTQTEYENSFTFKVFIFQFVNYYSSIFYIAFFKGKFAGYPGHYSRTLGIRNEECSSGGCLMELAIQLLIIMVGKQAINNVQELVIPALRKWWQNKGKPKDASSQKKKLTKPWEISYYKLVPFEGLFSEYLEMVLQFGFITIFVAAFPLAPLLALLNNWIEIRLDARKFVCELRRPVADCAQHIGVWYEILDTLVQIAVITNAFLISFTSEFIPRLLYEYRFGNGTLRGYTNFSLSYAPVDSGLNHCRYFGYRDLHGNHTKHFYMLVCCRLAFVVVFEHVVFFVGRIIGLLVPDIPEKVMLKMKREQYLAKQALTDNMDPFMKEMLELRSRHYSSMRLSTISSESQKMTRDANIFDTIKEEDEVFDDSSQTIVDTNIKKSKIDDVAVVDKSTKHEISMEPKAFSESSALAETQPVFSRPKPEEDPQGAKLKTRFFVGDTVIPIDAGDKSLPSTSSRFLERENAIDFPSSEKQSKVRFQPPDPSARLDEGNTSRRKRRIATPRSRLKDNKPN